MIYNYFKSFFVYLDTNPNNNNEPQIFNYFNHELILFKVEIEMFSNYTFYYFTYFLYIVVFKIIKKYYHIIHISKGEII